MSNERRKCLELTGVRENNLKNLNLTIPHDKLVVVTGVSGSGKSTLAFDTIYAEGGRRYIETFSPYTRQFLDRLHQPDIDGISGVRPALALEQRNRTTSSRSTVGTITEINDYLKVIWSQISTMKCPQCGQPIRHGLPHAAAEEILNGAKDWKTSHVIIAFPLTLTGQATLESICTTLQAEGFLRYFSLSSSSVRKLDECVLEPPAGELLVVVDRIALDLDPASVRKTKDRLISSITQGYQFGHGQIRAIFPQDAEPGILPFREEAVCRRCHLSLPLPKPALFTFNSPLGACKVCHGFGKVLDIDPELVIPDPGKSIDKGAIVCWSTASTQHELRKLKNWCRDNGIDTSIPWGRLDEQSKNEIFNGRKSKRGSYRGIKGWFEKLKRKRHKMHVRMFLSRFRSESLCEECGGGRLQPQAFCYFVRGKTIREIWNTPVEKLLPWFEMLAAEFEENEFAHIAIEEVVSRLRFLVEIGLSYLTLDRQTKTLSGGENQRVNLTSILGTRLVNTILVLDEPTIGLHSRDTTRLINVLRMLRDRGNSLIVVEHDQEVIRAADEVIDLGPESGSRGGEVIFQGPIKGLAKCKNSYTGKYLSRELELTRKRSNGGSQNGAALTVSGAKANNLKNIDVTIPLGKLVVLSGVSGSGKSSFVVECLHESCERLRQGVPFDRLVAAPDSTITGIKGLELLDEIALIDQSPVGKTPRANPGTYTKAWDIIRDALAETSQAEQLGLGRSAFSFNVEGGRCPACEGAGHHRIEMQFLADVFIECERCGGSRFKDAVLSVRLGRYNVSEILNLPLQDVVGLFDEIGDEKRSAKLKDLVNPLIELGLGYLKIGQPLSELSGGEAQRLKLASYMRSDFKGRCLFILDEPTTGLHPYNIHFLLATFDKLLERGHSILCVEHNLDVIRSADWVIDLGPEGGERGGRIVFEGRPEELLQDGKDSATAAELALTEGRSLTDQAVYEPAEDNAISITGARQHNLKNISVQIPKEEFTVITGVSGSGKSTLAFDILFEEGQRRYIDCLSPYARQYITQLKRAEVDLVESIPPTIAISQKTSPPHGVSTVATVTEIYQYLRLLYSKAGTQRCPDHDLPIESRSVDSLCDDIVDYARGGRVFLFAPVVSERKGYYNELFNRALRADLEEARIDGQIVRLTPELRLERHKVHTISLLVASLNYLKKCTPMLREAVEQALLLSSGIIEVVRDRKSNEPLIFSTERVCPECRRGFRELDPRDFSFRSARGMCPTCGGRGVIGEEDEETELCPECEGARIGPVGRAVTIGERRIYELSALNAPALLGVLESFEFEDRMQPVVAPILREVCHRLNVISSVGLDYLKLDRDASSLSGGEAQRLRLARALGSPLTGICYVLDEPTIGLHPQDHGRLMQILANLKGIGNTVVVVEHDEETICEADHVIDMGPGGGTTGGQIVAEGSVAELLQNKVSATGLALRERLQQETQKTGRIGKPSAEKKAVRLIGASANNLRLVNAEFPLRAMTVVCGVSGAGKSSLVHGSLVPAVIEAFEGSKRKSRSAKRTWDQLQQHESLCRFVGIDQSPVGKTSASTPASYLGVFDDIRKIFAMLPEAKARGWTASHFSFNSGKGKCENCKGKGFLKVPMSFLPEATAVCEECNGLRYNQATLEVLYQGLSIGQVLTRTMSEALQIFSNHHTVRRTLEYVNALGLGYLTLGQPTHTLSGGEAQRLKIARELGAREAVDTLYVLDEPTVGLHMTDIDKLLNVLRRLIDKGNTVVMIEHNLDVIQAADHLIELGPGPGEAGGTIVFSGTPPELLKSKGKSPTKAALRSRRANLLRDRLVRQEMFTPTCGSTLQ